MVAKQVMEKEPEPKSVIEAQQGQDWSKWENAINSEIDSLIKRKVFGPITKAPANTHLIGYKWMFVKKTNDKGIVVRYKACLVAKGFTQKLGQDYSDTYAPVMDSITYRLMIFICSFSQIEDEQMDVVTAYLYGMLDTSIYMRAPPELLKRLDYQRAQGECKLINYTSPTKTQDIGTSNTHPKRSTILRHERQKS